MEYPISSKKRNISLSKGTKIIHSPVSELPVMESFYTIQGEGFHQGKAAFFIRLGGCDVGCHWCDVKESWDASQFPLIPTDEIALKVSSYPAEICVVTGGEPLMYNLEELTGKIRRKGKKTHIETSGAYAVTGKWDWICFSPKKFKPPHRDIYQKADELKVVIYNKSDFEWAESFAGKVNSGCHLFLQPEWSKAEQVMPLIVEYVKRNPQWKISLQIHKYMHIP